MSGSAREAILAAGRLSAQSHGYGGLNMRELAAEVGIKAASIYHHFPSKADLAAAIAERYWQDTRAWLDEVAREEGGPTASLRKYPQTFRMSLENGNRLCLGSFLGAEYDDLPEHVRQQVQTFADVNIAWLADRLLDAGLTDEKGSEARARAIFAAVAGAQLLARSRSDISLFDAMIDSYRAAGLLPA
ncbi:MULTISPECIES: TetR/AcrR family transcriptional regulator [unclassified Rhizobium]|uniref:TetR/AcrR family transcriptional regulator n=1 Tax=unclassified Rhizobium TaxID=2613769 RepID=UPI002169B1AD|nr:MULTISPECIES: TetR/AcrR family transcriptional regulator [unclassified Rhizobium]MCS3743372.1 TetR/AcrR family transcriptional repressor of nem operon [Rhizobium sp. BK661]MCS4095897.1 TetR/AcrR family transcriptional repressor of nem operon [Rhizobium sp. BK176]